MRAPGTNCDRETVIALEMAGADVESVHLERLLAAARDLDDFGLVVLPGGFSFGDHLGAGTLWAHRLEAVREALDRFVESGRPVLGICNGFQALLRLGLLNGGGLAPNASGHFECRWIWMRRPDNARSPLLDGIDRIAMPIGAWRRAVRRQRRGQPGGAGRRAARSASSTATRMAILAVIRSIRMDPTGRSRH